MEVNGGEEEQLHHLDLAGKLPDFDIDLLDGGCVDFVEALELRFCSLHVHLDVFLRLACLLLHERIDLLVFFGL